MQIMCHRETYPNGKTETLTNFRIAEAIINICDEDYNDEGLNAEVVAKMILLQIDARKGGEQG